MPKLDGILETAIHTEDMARARANVRGASFAILLSALIPLQRRHMGQLINN